MPKGVLLVGIPGTGKTHFAKVASWVLAQNLWTFFIGELLGSKGSLVGSAEIVLARPLVTIAASNGSKLIPRRADTQPPARPPRPSPSMNAVTTMVTDSELTPKMRNNSRCQVSW